MTYCMNCNHKVNDEDNYCTHCGNKIKWNTVEEHYDINNRVEKVKRLKYFDEELDRMVRLNEDFLVKAEDYYKNAVCPYCGIISEKKIEKAKKCPECKNKIIKRTNYYNRNGLLLKDSEIIKYSKYDEKIRYIMRKDREIDSIMFFDVKYMDYFKKLKEKGDLSVRDLIYSFCNYCACEMESEALQIYQNPNKDWHAAYEFQGVMHSALLNWNQLYRICIEDYKDEIALDLLTMMSYKSMVSIMIFYELLDYNEGLNKSGPLGFLEEHNIISYCESNNIKLKDFKKIFLSKNYSFLIFDKPKELVWKYIEKEITDNIKFRIEHGGSTTVL